MFSKLIARLSATLFVLMALNLACVQAMTYTNQFKNWFPQYGWIYEKTLHENCTEQYANYLTGKKDHSKIDALQGGGTFSALTQPVIQCILSNVSEYIKAQGSSAQVLLGVAPTILALMGPSTDETAVFLLIARRPFLFILLACGSPSVYFDRAFKYTNPDEILADHSSRLQKKRVSGWLRVFVTIAEYVFVVAAIANIAHVNYELGTKAICAIMSDWIWAPMLWGILGILVHIVSAVSKSGVHITC